MNEFYSISEANANPIDQFQLKNLGIQHDTISFGNRRRDGYGGNAIKRTTLKENIKKSDYDWAFAFKIISVNPPYELDEIGNYHLNFYINNGGDKSKFIKHMRYVILPYLQQYYDKRVAHIELFESWISEQNKAMNRMIEFTDLNEIEKDALNFWIQNTPQDVISASTIWFEKTEIEELVKENKSYHSERIILFLLKNDFITNRTQSSYELTEQGKRLFKLASLEKYYGKQALQAHPSIHGSGNIVNISTGNISMSGVTININQDQYAHLKELGIGNINIEALNEIAENDKIDKPTKTAQFMKWLGEVTKEIVSKGLTENIVPITKFVGELINKL